MAYDDGSWKSVYWLIVNLSVQVCIAALIFEHEESTQEEVHQGD